MITNIDFFIQEAKRLLEEDILKHTTNLSYGCASSFDDYKRLVGVIQGLRDAGEILDVARKKADQVVTKT